MTTIAYRDGVLAADTRAYSGDADPIGFKAKIFRLSNGNLLGISTTLPGLSEEILDWVEAGMVKEDRPGFETSLVQLLLITPEGIFYGANTTLFLSGPLLAPYYAIGSGNQYALGAMCRGATALEAVEAAKEFDAWTDGAIMTLAIKP